MGEERTGRQSGHRVTVDEAARHLGLTVDAVRKRVQRGQIAYEKDEAGRVRIILDESETLQDKSPDNAGQATGAHEELVEELRDRVHYLERVLEEEREARTEERRRHDTLMAQLMQRIPELEAPSEAPPEARESTETVEAGQELDAERARRERAESTLHDGMDEERWRREEAERERDELSRELYALRQQRESPQTVEQEPERAESRPAPAGAQEGAQRRPWWRRVFG